MGQSNANAHSYGLTLNLTNLQPKQTLRRFFCTSAWLWRNLVPAFCAVVINGDWR